MYFDLNNLTDEEALELENALATRRILKAHSNIIPIAYPSIMSPNVYEHSENLKTRFSDIFKYNLFDDMEEIDEKHPEW